MPNEDRRAVLDEATRTNVVRTGGESPANFHMAPAPATTIMVCRTCPRIGPSGVAVGAFPSNLGNALADAVEALVSGQERLQLRRVECLSGCRRPGGAKLQSPGKPSIQFSGLKPHQADAIVALALLFHARDDGQIMDEDWPSTISASSITQTYPLLGKIKNEAGDGND